MTTVATIENMRRHYAPGVVAYSPKTGEEFSADPRDYPWLPPGEPLMDRIDVPCVLVRFRVQIVNVR